MPSGAASVWWATPADPERHFADADLMWSDHYHRQVRRAGAAGLAAKLGLLVAAALLLGRTGDHEGAAGRWFDEGSWLGAVVSWRVIVAAAVTIAALRLPAVVVDSWFEYRFRHGDADHRPIPVVGFALTTFSLTVGLFVLLAVATGLGYRLLGATGAWPLVIALVAVLANLTAALGERLVRQSEQPIADEQLAGNLAGLASRFNLPELRFAMTETVSALGPGREAPNAYSAGLGFSRRVVVTKALTEEPDEVRDFVVSHELSHVSGRHLAVQLVVTMAASVALIAMGVDPDGNRPTLELVWSGSSRPIRATGDRVSRVRRLGGARPGCRVDRSSTGAAG